MRSDGRSDHHNIFWMKSEEPRFVHISFGVENLDELLAGANHMQRPASLGLAGTAYRRPFISISRAQQVEKQNIPPIPSSQQFRNAHSSLDWPSAAAAQYWSGYSEGRVISAPTGH
jgi:hypothetical protein